MEVGMSLNALVRLPSSRTMLLHEDGGGLVKHSLFSTRKSKALTSPNKQGQGHMLLVVKAKGKKGIQTRQFQRPPPTPSLPKIEDDGNPKFLIFIRVANVCSLSFSLLIPNLDYCCYWKFPTSFRFDTFSMRFLGLFFLGYVYLWYPLSLITGGTTAKIMVAAKDNFLGKYIYKDTLARNLAAVIYKDEKEIQKTAFKQHRVLRTATEFRYGYKLVENGNLRAALSITDVIELPTPDKLKTVLDKVKDFFGDAKESFGKLTALNSTATEEEEVSKEKANVC
ncbi:hypothetical protein D5086_019386 [Populus alba]|uniref:Uncharacterized protein n=1 Tax=Populus alba TaxID=43335 RepID=A0ACC4BIG5_POPAL